MSIRDSRITSCNENLGIEPGDEVIVPTLTFITAVNPVETWVQAIFMIVMKL